MPVPLYADIFAHIIETIRQVARERSFGKLMPRVFCIPLKSSQMDGFLDHSVLGNLTFTVICSNAACIGTVIIQRLTNACDAFHIVENVKTLQLILPKLHPPITRIIGININATPMGNFSHHIRNKTLKKRRAHIVKAFFDIETLFTRHSSREHRAEI